VQKLHNLKGNVAMQTQKNMGKIWKNPTKKEDKHPDLKGYLWIDGIKYDLGGWQRDEDGRVFYSLSARQYENPDNQGIAKTVARGNATRVPADGFQSAHDLNDAIPF
jgi:hypothetical protein